MNITLTGTFMPGQSGLKSNGNEHVISHSLELQNCIITTSCSLVLYPRHTLF